MYEIHFYSRRVENEFTRWPAGILADFLRTIELMMVHGPKLGMPKTKALEKGLFEIRAKGKEGIGRAFFCTVKGRQIIILHGFIKKSQNTPLKELETARRRMKDVLK